MRQKMRKRQKKNKISFRKGVLPRKVRCAASTRSCSEVEGEMLRHVSLRGDLCEDGGGYVRCISRAALGLLPGRLPPSFHIGACAVEVARLVHVTCFDCREDLELSGKAKYYPRVRRFLFFFSPLLRVYDLHMSTSILFLKVA